MEIVNSEVELSKQLSGKRCGRGTSICYVARKGSGPQHPSNEAILFWVGLVFFVISAHGTLVYVLFSGRSRLKTSENRVLQRLKWRLDITPNDPRVAIQVLARFRRMRLDLQDEVTGKTKASGKRMGWTKCHIYNALCGGLRIFQKKP